MTLTGTFRCLRAVLPHMYERGSGAVVNNASVLGWRAQELQAHYAAAKAGVMALTRTAGDRSGRARRARERASRRQPGDAPVPGQGHPRRPARRAHPQSEAFGRAAEPWEVANVMVFLASDYASYMTGEVLSVSSQHA
ncbi:MAG: SDR family oxidoreductase [Cypionkella sp.]